MKESSSNRTPLRIGVMIKDFEKLQSFELSLIDQILDDNRFKIAVLLKDGRNLKTTRKLTLSKILFKVQFLIEQKIFPSIKAGNRIEKQKRLKGIKTIELKPQRKGKFIDYFSEEDCLVVKKEKLDVIIRLSFAIIKGEIFNCSKYGVWGLHHGDNSINRGGPPCFWEIYRKEDVIGVTLQKLNEKLDGGEIIDKAYYNNSWSMVFSRDRVFALSVELFLKNLRMLYINRVEYNKSKTYSYPLYLNPNVGQLLNYCLSFYKNLFLKVWTKFDALLFRTKHQHWQLSIGKGRFSEATLYKSIYLENKKNEFWADPFLIEENGRLYVFFENYPYKEKKGNISCGIIRNNQVSEVREVLNLPYHLSYPNIFHLDNEIYMIPETGGNRRMEIYKSKVFPDTWELFSTAFEGERITDVNYFEDENNDKWLFINKGEVDVCNELYIYKIDNLKLLNIIPHKLNPVIIDSRFARNAGPIYIENGKIIRPSQINIKGRYGYGINLNEILTLTLDDYVEKLIVKVEPKFDDNIIGTHHVHQYKDQFIFDICNKRYR